MAGLFRKNVLDRLSSPERTDLAPLFSPRSGLFLLCAAVLAALCIAAPFVLPGIFPASYEGGVLAVPEGASCLCAPSEGRIERVYAAPGARVSPSMPLMAFAPAGEGPAELYPCCAGAVFSVSAPGEAVSAQQPLALLTPSENLCALFAVPRHQAAALSPGMQADLILSGEHYPAAVVSVDRIPSPSGTILRFFPDRTEPLCLLVIEPASPLPDDAQSASVCARLLP